MADILPRSDHSSFTLEFGTVPEVEMILATRAEQWVHRHGDRRDPVAARAILDHRRCFTPDEPSWATTAMAHGRSVLAAAMAAVAT